MDGLERTPIERFGDHPYKEGLEGHERLKTLYIILFSLGEGEEANKKRNKFQLPLSRAEIFRVFRCSSRTPEVANPNLIQ